MNNVVKANSGSGSIEEAKEELDDLMMCDINDEDLKEFDNTRVGSVFIDSQIPNKNSSVLKNVPKYVDCRSSRLRVDKLSTQHRGSIEPVVVERFVVSSPPMVNTNSRAVQCDLDLEHRS